MLVKEAVEIYSEYLKGNCRPNTIRSFGFVLIRMHKEFGTIPVESISDTNIIEFVNSITEGCSITTKSNRVGAVKAFFNFVIEVTDATFQNPCARPLVRKLFKKPKASSPKLLDKDIIDEIIFSTSNIRNRLLLELMGRAGMRIGEVLNMRVSDIDFDSATILLTAPKSGRTGEKVYLTKKLARKLKNYIASNEFDDRIFSISYSTAYRVVRDSGKLVNSFLRPHDLRRHAATQASRNNIPLEIVSKVILRHADISTTQRYLGAIDPEEASRWVEHLNR